MATVAEKLITAEEFAKMPAPPDGSKQEEHKQGHVTVETGRVTERDPDTVRGPDVSFWSVERLPLDQRPQGYPEVAADLCVEILSPTKRLKKIKEKIREYFAREFAWYGWSTGGPYGDRLPLT